MVRRRVLLLLKPMMNIFNSASTSMAAVKNLRIRGYLEDRCRIHNDTVNFCQDVLRRKSVDWETLLWSNLSQPIHNVDLVISIGGDGTLLQASHSMDDSVPILGVNSDPTQAEEVEEYSNEFDATRSTGYLCAATAENFEQVIDEIMSAHMRPTELSRISVCLNGQVLPTLALNDVLIAHPCPATASRFSFLIKSKDKTDSSLMNCRSSGLRICTAAGSTAAMLSAGGFPMPITSKDLQYMVREPIKSSSAPTNFHGVIQPNQSMVATWYCKEGVVYIDGSHVLHLLSHGDTMEISSRAPTLKAFLPSHLLKKL